MGATTKNSRRLVALILGAVLLLAVMPFALRIVATAEDEDNTPLFDKELVVDEELDDKPATDDPDQDGPDPTDPTDGSDPADPTKPTDPTDLVDPTDPTNPTDPTVEDPINDKEAFPTINNPDIPRQQPEPSQDEEGIKILLNPRENVTTQAELDAALADSVVTTIIVDNSIVLDTTFNGVVNGTKSLAGSGSVSLRRDAGNAGSLFSIPVGSGLSVSDLTIEGVSNETAGRGPLFSVASGANLTILNGATLFNNANTDASRPLGGAIYNAGTVTMSGGSIANNKITALTTVYGGGIYNGAGATFTLNGGTISSNRIDGAQAYGGGAYIAPGSVFSMTGGTISANSVTGSSAQGGGLYLGATPSNAIGLGAITSNSVSGQGAGVFAAANAIFSGTRISSNQATLGNDPTESGKGGGIYVADGVDAVIRGSTVIDDNEAIGGGGVFVSVDGTLELMRFDGSDPTLSNNVAKGNSARGRSGDGGAIFALGTLTANGVTVTGNNATDNGGGISARNVVNLTRATFTNNKAFYGGGLRISSLATVVCDSVAFNANTAQIGGAIMNHGELVLRGTSIFDNNVSQQLNDEGSSVTNLWLPDSSAPVFSVQGALHIDTPVLLAIDPNSGANGVPVMLSGALTGDPLVIGGFGRVHGSDQSNNDPDGGVITADTRYRVTVDLAVGDVVARGLGYRIATADEALIKLAQAYSAYSTTLTENNEIVVTGSSPKPTPTPTPTPDPAPTPDPTPPGPQAGTGDYMLEAAEVTVGFSLIGLIAAMASAVHIRRRFMKRRL